MFNQIITLVLNKLKVNPITLLFNAIKADPVGQFLKLLMNLNQSKKSK